MHRRTTVIHIENLSKTYRKGNIEALTNINLDIREGEFTALLGQNGAGKSTLINILAGNVKKNTGRVVIGGFDLDRHELDTKKVIGIVPQEIAIDYLFTVDEVLRRQSGYFGFLHNGPYIDELLDALTLSDKRHARVSDLSGGMKRRLMIAKALIHRPKILVLDEPTAGVDVEMRRSMYEYIERLNRNGTTIILTTHYLEEAEKLCGRIIVINDGRIIADESKKSMMEKQGRHVIVEVHVSRDLSPADVTGLAEFEPRIAERTILYLKVEKTRLMEVVQKLTNLQLDIVNLVIEKPKLEDIYLDLINR